jgi:hypothetical protein
MHHLPIVYILFLTNSLMAFMAFSNILVLILLLRNTSGHATHQSSSALTCALRHEMDTYLDNNSSAESDNHSTSVLERDK